MPLPLHPRERKDLLLSWLAISLAFAIVMVPFKGFTVGRLAVALLISLVTVGLGFIAHELAHRWVARKHNCHAEYQANPTMLLVAIATSLFGIVFAAPGAVHISGHPSHEERGMISLAGPVANLALGVVFLALFLLGEGWFAAGAGFGAVINTWLALFNMLPFAPFDGQKILIWNRTAYGVTVGVAVLLTFLQVPLGLLW